MTTKSEHLHFKPLPLNHLTTPNLVVIHIFNGIFRVVLIASHVNGCKCSPSDYLLYSKDFSTNFQRINVLLHKIIIKRYLFTLDAICIHSKFLRHFLFKIDIISLFNMDSIRSIVSQKKKRFTEEGFNLDLTYVCPRVIAMAFPAEGTIEKMYRNPIDKVSWVWLR